MSSIKKNAFKDPYFNSTWIYHNGYITASSGRKVGINTNTPVCQLDVSGSLKTTNIVDASGNVGLGGQLLSSTNGGFLWINQADISGQRTPTGNTLFVDAVYGNDTLGASNPNAYPFKTISAALLSALSGNLVVVNAGTYNETLTIPNGVSLSGTGAQAVIIQKLNVTQDTTLITVGSNCRVENFTANLSSSGNYNLTGINFPSGTSINTKLRNSIWTITSTASGSPTIIGVLSAGTSSTAYNPANAIQRCTINVISSSTGISRGILVSGPNRFAVRDIVVYARGTGTNIIGGETTDASAVLEIKTSTIGGTSHDIDRTLGTILLGATDLLNNDANGNSFSVTQAPASFQYGVTGSLATNRRYYLVAGTSTTGSLTNEAVGSPYSSAKAFPIVLTQSSTVIELSITYTETLTSGQSVTFSIYKNNVTPAALSLTLNAGENVKNLKTQSVVFDANDTIETTLEVVGNPTGLYPAFSALVYYY